MTFLGDMIAQKIQKDSRGKQIISQDFADNDIEVQTEACGDTMYVGYMLRNCKTCKHELQKIFQRELMTIYSWHLTIIIETINSKFTYRKGWLCCDC